MIESRPVDRTATFAFFIGDKFFGTITAYVLGRRAGDYHFSSAVAVQLLKSLAPALRSLLGTGPSVVGPAPVPAERSKGGSISTTMHQSPRNGHASGVGPGAAPRVSGEKSRECASRPREQSGNEVCQLRFSSPQLAQ